MILVMENQGYGQIIGNSAAPCVNSLASTYLRATDSYARGHDSLPNYLEMISGHAYEASGTSERLHAVELRADRGHRHR